MGVSFDATSFGCAVVERKGTKGEKGDHRSRTSSVLTTEEFGDGQTIPQGLVGPPGPPGPPGRKVNITLCISALTP